MVQIIKRAKYLTKYLLWTLNGYIGKQISINSTHNATVMITYYYPIRMKHINSQIRNILKCKFIEKVIISNHNPEIKIEDKITINDKRLVYINQNRRRGCGYRWHIAKTLSADYIISIDDDILLFPFQLKELFQHLVQEPQLPHGFSGFILLENEEIQYRERQNIDVNYLCEVYAVTKKQIELYFEIERLLVEKDRSFLDLIENYHDFIVISKTGSPNPKIHKVGTIFRSDTFNTPGVALHKDEQWASSVFDVSRAVQEIRSQKLV
jgi:hypothetical protein